MQEQALVGPAQEQTSAGLVEFVESFACRIRKIENGEPLPNVLFWQPSQEKSKQIDVKEIEGINNVRDREKREFVRLFAEKCGLRLEYCSLIGPEQIVRLFDSIRKSNERCMVVVENCNELMRNHEALFIFLSYTGMESAKFLICGFLKDKAGSEMHMQKAFLARFALIPNEIGMAVKSSRPSDNDSDKAVIILGDGLTYTEKDFHEI